MKILTPQPPKDLSTAARRLFRGLQSEYSIVDVAGLALLTDACRFFDRREQARETIRLEGATVKDRFEQTVAHPSIRIERDAAASMRASFKALNLDITPLNDKPGRPPGR